MNRIKTYKCKDIFLSLKQSLLGRINDNDIKFLKERFKKYEETHYKKISFYKGYAKLIYYNINKPQTYPMNKQWLRIKEKIDNSNYFLIGSIDDEYTHNGEIQTYYKYFRFYEKYSILELVSDYYNKIPIFFHLSNGEYEVLNDIECIKGIDSIPKLY